MHRATLITLLLAGAATAAAAGDEMKSGDAMMGDGSMKMHAATTFMVKIENVSTPATLRSKSGATAPAPNSPGLWAISTGGGVVFAAGKVDRGLGLESQAEDGDPSKLAAAVKGMKNVTASGVFNTPAGDDKPGPALPGKAYEFSFDAHPGDRLTLTTMFGQSNDLFYAPKEAGIALFEKGKPMSGDLTSQLYLWDAGTEVNQEPGFGADQAPRQVAPNTGTSEKKPVRLVADAKDGFKYPAVAQVIRVTITPAAMTMK
jgi:hypothetical protein